MDCVNFNDGTFGVALHDDIEHIHIFIPRNPSGLSNNIGDHDGHDWIGKFYRPDVRILGVDVSNSTIIVSTYTDPVTKRIWPDGHATLICKGSFTNCKISPHYLLLWNTAEAVYIKDGTIFRYFMSAYTLDNDQWVDENSNRYSIENGIKIYA